ncbi:MAG TPA: redoxin domain-containing protein [Pyrinomonadaceae bacterium]|nr:redoxin domain-containing protein [Pyrinomonadaceae bacterium]
MPVTGMEMPSLEGATEWFNATGARAAAEAQGHPTLVHFWSVSCDTCEDDLKRLTAWREKYAELRVIAVHVPQSEADRDAEKVRDCITLRKMTEPCAVDNEHKLRAAFQLGEQDAPAYYLYDAGGRLFNFASGEQGLDTIGAALEKLFAGEAGGAATN